MFKNEYQGGPHLDVFSVQGKDPLAKLKITGPSSCIRKEFDNDIRTFILSLNGDSVRSKISFPKGSKQSLHLTQPYLVFQIYLQTGQSFTLEIVLLTKSNSKLRLIFSSSNREITIAAHHIKMPCSVVHHDTWVTLCIDLSELVTNYFEGDMFGYVDSITVSANCKLKRIFTLKDKPLHSLSIPKGVDFPSSVESTIQNLDYDCFTSANINIRSGTGNPYNRTPLNKSSNNENTHIAFGSRAVNKNTDENESHTNSSSARSKSGKNKSKLNESNKQSLLTSRAIDLLPLKVSNKSMSKSSNNDDVVDGKIKFQPKPPDKNTKKNVRKPRVVKSADVKSRAVARSDPTPNQTFSKSADSRNRRKPSTSEIDPNVEPKELALPIIKIKKGISRSAIDLEKMEHEICEKRELHFKSQSLSVLPKIGSTRNDRYAKVNSVSYEPELDDVFNNTGEEEAELMSLAGEHEVDDYLKNRTMSSCRDDESLSSCNSASSDLYTYSSRPRSVIKKQPDNFLVVSSPKPRNNSRTNSNANNHSESNADPKNSKSEDRTNTPIKENNTNFTKENKKEAVGVDLSWEYSESTSMLVIPKDLMRNNLEEQTDLGISLECDDQPLSVQENEEEVQIKPMSTEEKKEQSTGVDHLSSDEKTEPLTETENLSSGIVSDVSSDNDNNNNMNNKTNTNTNNNNNNIHSSYTMRDSCDSDSMSWLHNSQDASNLSVAMTNTLDKIKSPQMALRQRLKEQLGSLIVQSNDVESESEGFSDCSDDTTYTDLPPKRFRNYRYQDEIKSISSTLDLSATIPATPMVGEQARLDENNNGFGGKLDDTANEELLDLMFDPVLNCYYDPVTHKYYELN